MKQTYRPSKDEQIAELRAQLAAARKSLTTIAAIEIDREKRGDMAYAFAFGQAQGEAKLGLAISEPSESN